MSKYTIKNFQEEFLEEQEKVGIEATKDWSGFGQTPAATLKQIYSGENFDPETKFYAFDGDKLVGFLTSTILPEQDGIKKANLEFPIVLAEHEECAELLFNSAIETLKKKGVKKVQTRVGDVYKGTQEKADAWGYNFSQDLYIFMEAKVEDISVDESDIEVLEFDSSRDLEQMIEIFVNKFGATKEYAQSNFERITKDKESFPVHLVIRKDDKIVGRALAYLFPRDPKEFNLGNFYFEDEKYFVPLLSQTLSRIKEHDAEMVSQYLYGSSLSLEEQYKSFGFSRAGKIDYYEKEI